MALITGTVFDDLTGDGLTVDDPALAGVAVSLSRDGGNGVFDAGTPGGDDVLIGTQSTNAQGQYEFEFLSEGRYFVEQAAVPGRLQHPGENVVTQDISNLEALGIPGVLVDDFSPTSQLTVANTSKPTNSSAVAASEAIGGERDFLLQLTSASGSLSMDANGVTPDLLEFAASAVATGRRTVIWDGPDGNGATLNPTGLGGVDLTDGGISRYLNFRVGADHSDGELQVRIYSDSVNWSLGEIAIPDTGGAATAMISLPFRDFVTQAGHGADFSDVGAIELEIAGGQAVDGQLDVLRSYAPLIKTVNFATYEPLSLGDVVWNDANNDGQFGQTEQPFAGVAIDLFEDSDGSGNFTPGIDTLLASTLTDLSGRYLFESLFPNTYVVRINPSNFDRGAILRGFLTSTGNTPTPDPDDNVNNDDNGDALVGQGVVSRAITLTAMAEPTNDGDADANSNLTVDFGFFPVADLLLDKADDVDPVTAGQPLTYTLTITNLGQSAATGVTVTDPLPAGVTFVSASSSQGSVSQSNGTVTALLGGLSEDGVATVTINVRVSPGTSGTISNTATVTANESDSVPSNNIDTEPTVVIARTDLEIVKTDNVDPVVAGELLTYGLTITNHGPSNATGVTVADLLPANVMFLSSSTTQGSVSVTNGLMTANLGDLAVGNSATVFVTARVASSATGSLSNTGNVSGNETDPVPSNNSDTEPTAIIVRTDLEVVKTDNPDPVTAGETLTYSLLVTNHGPSNATGVLVNDPLPAGTTFVSATTSQGTVSANNGILTANLGNLADDEFETITVTVMVASGTTGTLLNTATVTGNEPDPVPTNNSDSEPTVVVTRTDLAIVKSDDVDPVTAGELLTYTLVITNHGPSNATGVAVSDPLPAGVTFNSATTTQGTVSVNNGVVTASIGNLASNGSATVTVTVRVNSSTTANLNNTATVTGNEPDSTPGNNTDSEPTVVTARTDLEIVKSDNVDPVTAGELLVYSLTVTNHGPSDATGVSVVDPFPAGTTFVSATATQGNVSSSNGVLSSSVGNLANNASATITVTVRVNSSTTANLNNTATVTGNEPDPIPRNNSDSEPTVVVTRTDLEIVKSDNVDPVTAGELLTYTLQVTNHGPSDATGVSVSDPLPAGTTFVSATSTQGNVVSSNGVVTSNVGNLANNASATITVTVRVNSSTTANLTNTATVTGNQPDPIPGNNSDSEPTVVVARTDLAIVKSDNVDPVTAGETLTYTLVITNHGPSNATGVTVNDPLPAGTTFTSATTTQGTVSAVNGVLTAIVGDLANNATATVAVTVRVNSSTTGNLNNTATVSGNQPDPVPGNNSDSEPTAIVTNADVEVFKTDSSDPVVAGELLTYTLLVTNHGPSDASGVRVSDPLPAGTTFVSATTTQGAVSASSGVVTATVGSLADDATATILVTVRVAPSQTTDLSNTATVTANPPDPVPSNNTSNKITRVIPRVDLEIRKNDDVDPVVAGRSLTYTLLVLNHGPSNATGVTVVDALPSGVTFASATTTQGTVSVANGIVTANLNVLADDATATVTINVTVNPSTTGTINNTASVSGNETELAPSNNQDSEPTTVVPQIDLAITKNVSAGPVEFDVPFSYTLLVFNNGPSDATGVTVVDAVPAGLTIDSVTTTRGTASHVNGTVTANIGNLEPSASATLTLSVRSTGIVVGSITNTANVSGRETETTLVNNSAQVATSLEPKRASLSGFSYEDADDDGIFDVGETPIPGVTVTLIGVDLFGNSVNLVRQTGADGAYRFNDLRPGNYRIVESQPTNYRDGKDTSSTVLSSTTSNDQFSDINLTAGTNGTAFNFGELRRQLSKRNYLASSGQ